MESYRRLKDWVESNRDLAFELVRIYLGVGLVAKGIYFSSHIDSALTLIDHGQLMVGNIVVAHYIAMGHLAGGLLLAVGLLTRIAAVAQIPILAGAVFAVHLREGFFQRGQNLEFAVMVLFLLVMVAFHGGGRLSADYRLAADQDYEQRPDLPAGETSPRGATTR